MIFLGCTIGLLIGAMPGLGSVNGVAILLPITFLVPPTAAIIFLAAIYYGAMYGGAISSITLGIPGASTAVATVFDGRPLAQAGKADRALTAAAVASFIGGTISVVLFTLFAPPLAEFALKFGPPEEFALMVLAFATFIGLGGDDIPKTIFSILIGLVLAAVGLDIISGKPRLIFGDISGFLHGINFLVLAIGIYGIGEMLWTLEQTQGKVTVHKVRMSFSRLFRNVKRREALHRHHLARLGRRVLRRDAAGSRRDAGLPDVLRPREDVLARSRTPSARATSRVSPPPRPATTRLRPGRCCR